MAIAKILLMMNIRFLKIGIVTVLGLLVIDSTVHAVTKIKDTKHNLSNWGKYDVKASGTLSKDTEVCIFCHAPHNADSTQAPLWNHEDTAITSFTVATTANVSPSKGVGNTGYVDPSLNYISKKCMSCHDGTVAIGATLNNDTITMSGNNVDFATGQLKTSAPGYISPDGSGSGNKLSQGHVISFVYDTALVSQLGAAYHDMPAADKPKMLDKNNKMHCHTCHDPHNDWCNDSSKSVGNDPLWRLACSGGKNISVCEKCHDATFDYYTSPKYPF